MNSRYELKRILLNLTALLMAVLMLLTFVSCSNDDDNEIMHIRPYGMCVWSMPNRNVVRVEFVKLKQRKNEDEFVFKIKEFLNVSNDEYSKETGETISFISPMIKDSKRSYIMNKLHNYGYEYEEGKEYIIMYSEGNNLDIYCYIPLDGLDKTCQIIKDESVDYGFSLDVPPDEFVADLKEVIVKLKMFQNVFETEDAIEWPFPLNNENQQSGELKS